LHAEICACRLCPLAEARTNAVPGEGAADAELMFVGEAPGEQEDLQGRPFVGQAGKLLDELLVHAGIERSRVFITNIVKCRPPGNREPEPREVEACRPYLIAQIATFRPRLICPLGGPAVRTLLGAEFQIGKVHGQVLRRGGILYVPLYHPAAALHRGNLRQTLFEDILALRRALEQMQAVTPATREGAG